MPNFEQSVETTTAQAQSSVSSEAIAKFSFLTAFCMAIVLIIGLVLDWKQVALAFVVGAVFFLGFGVFVVLVLSGQLAAIVNNYFVQKTIQRRDVMQFQLYFQPAPQLEDAERPNLPDLRPSLPSFVPAVPSADEGIKIAAYDFVYQLFKEGRPDPERILGPETKRPYQIQFKNPRPEVLDYLLSLGMVSRHPQTRNLLFNVTDCPTLREAQQAIKHGVPLGKRT